MSRGLDYAFSPTGAASFWWSRGWLDALDAYGAKFVCRYTSTYRANDANGKNLTRPERDALAAAGISIVLVAEEDAGRMRGGRSAGVYDAQHAAVVASALGLNGIPVYFAADWDVAEHEQQLVNAYLDGAASVIGRARTGIYGGLWAVRRALDAGKAAYAWQTIAWSGGEWDPRANIRQGLSIRLAGASADPDESMTPDYGQWPRLRPVARPQPAEDDMIWLPDTGRPIPLALDTGVDVLRFVSGTVTKIRVDWVGVTPDPPTVERDLGYGNADQDVETPPGAKGALVRRLDPDPANRPLIACHFVRL